jgi:catechol 2,3-dioxygenase-like lactoylglutathione lyase family enzyme
MQLGRHVQISMGVPDLAAARQFYDQLGFQLIDQQTEPWPWAQVSDGQILLLLNQDGNLYTGLLYMSPAADEVVAHLETLGVGFIHRQEREDGVLQQVIFGAHNLLVSVANHDPAGLYQPAGEPLSRCGKFGEFAIPVADFTAASTFWQQVGFEIRYESTEPYQWGIFNDGNIVLGLHAVQNMAGDEKDRFYFPHPTMTYFNADMAARIASLRAGGLPFQAGYDGGPGNAILIAPGDQRIFLFEGEV